MSAPSSRTLRRALEVLGTKERLCSALEIRLEELDAYLEGKKPLPNALFLAALDIVAGRGVPPKA